MYGYERFTPHAELTNFEVRLIVAGTRDYDDYAFFSECMDAHVERFFKGKSICFITGRARTGADDMIVRWCDERGFPIAAFPADWDLYGKGAGYIRNTEMAKHATDLVTFYDGRSKGTRHMVEAAIKRSIVPVTIIIDIKKDESHVQHQPQSSRSSDPGVRGETVAW